MIQGGDFDKGNVGALLILSYMLIVCGLYLVKSVADLSLRVVR